MEIEYLGPLEDEQSAVEYLGPLDSQPHGYTGTWDDGPTPAEQEHGVIRQPDKSNIFQEAGRGLKRGFYGAQETLGTALDVLGADNLGKGIA